MIRALLFAFSCLSLPVAACNFSDVEFAADFEGGRLDSCELTDNGEYVLTFLPEDKPINPSPWYYFSVTSKNELELKIVLSFDGYSPRYLPKMSRDKKHWTPILFDTDKRGMIIALESSKQPLFVSAQPPILNEKYKKWLKEKQSEFDIDLFTIGKSTENRVIDAFTLSRPSNSEWVVFVGRQHPPEVTGAVAMFSFLEEFLKQTASETQFLSRFNVLVVPNINPDGVANGHWRHSLGHKDLNRDWNDFSQPETASVKTFLDTISDKGGKIVFGMDFHSTHGNVFYTIPSSEPLAPSELVVDWLEELQEKTKGIFKVLDKPGTSPGKGVFKQFIADTYNVHGVTYEVGDNEPNEKTRYVARKAANALIPALLSVPPEGFDIKHTATEGSKNNE
ncbi:M14 family zinc carboxypeptidase [Alteromonas macleodii]|uniref:M14 family metallopeptidase n=1 Tax=Alteromonas macleodii TaxID=28108 RepID=UPI002076932D|nr:M14 family zinc carboxypeptidase [Alteromonas macleodii]USI29433.1 M14 family metallopeptidase [Alteromonas macleodii]